MFIKVASALLLALQLVKYILRLPSNDADDREFYNYVFSKLTKGGLPGWSGPYACIFVVSSALSKRAYDAALSMLRALIATFPWEQTSTPLLRRTFEVALIFGDRAIARQSFRAATSKASLPVEDRNRMDTLLRWRFEGLLANEAAMLDMASTFFKDFPEYDEYFKGSANELQGKSAQARFHFERSLALAPLAARELREALEKRIAGLGVASSP